MALKKNNNIYLEVTIDEQGTTTTEVFGVVGPSCKSLTAGIRAALGGKHGGTELKDEYHRDPKEVVHVR